MIVIRAEIWPFGDGDQAYEIGIIFAWNEGSMPRLAPIPGRWLKMAMKSPAFSSGPVISKSTARIAHTARGAWSRRSSPKSKRRKRRAGRHARSRRTRFGQRIHQ